MKFIKISEDKTEYFINLENINSATYYHPNDKHVEEICIEFIGDEKPTIFDGELAKSIRFNLEIRVI